MQQPDSAARGSFVPETPFQMGAGHRRVLEQALRSEAWLKSLGLDGIVTGVANPDLHVFASACERLSEVMKRVRKEGESAGVASERRRWQTRALIAAAVAIVASWGVVGWYVLR